MPTTTHRPLGDYGLIGDTRTAALAASDGSIDWMCVPRFDGDPIFGRLVGGSTAGFFRAGPARPERVIRRQYRPGTATLETTWETHGAWLTLMEGMVAELEGRLLPTTVLVRRLIAEGGPVDAVIEFDPRLGEARAAPRVETRGRIVVCSWGTLAGALTTSPQFPLEVG
jgi:GH15 family glucan-1,4-alpha-glucosidase